MHLVPGGDEVVDRCDAVGDGCQGALPESPSGPRIESDGSGGGNAESRDRVRLSVTALGAKARRAVARSGVIRLKVSTTAAGRIAAVAKGRLRMAGRRVRSLTLARAQVRVSGPGTRVVRLRLSPPALRVLRAGRAVPVVVRLTQGGARSRTLNFVLRRTGR